MAEYSRMAKGNFTSTGAAQIVPLPFVPDYVELINYTAAATPAQHGIPQAYWHNNMGQGFAIVDLFNATPALIMDSVDTNGISTFSAGLSFQLGAAASVDTISKAAAASIVTVSAHGLASGDVIMLQNIYQSTTTGMIQITNIPFTVTVSNSTTFTIPWNTNQSNYTAYDSTTALAGTGSQATFKKVLYPYLYAPGVNVITGIDTGTTTTIHTTNAHNFVVGQEVAFHIPTAWGTVELNTLPNSVIPGSPIYGYVVSVTDYNTVVVDIDSSSGYTAYDSNQTFASALASKWQLPQIAAVGDVNTGGVVISSGSALYPPPFIRPISTTTVNTINGPAVQGAFFNNTRQGFIIGAGTAAGDASSVLVGAVSDVIYWRAYLHDYV